LVDDEDREARDVLRRSARRTHDRDDVDERAFELLRESLGDDLLHVVPADLTRDEEQAPRLGEHAVAISARTSELGRIHGLHLFLGAAEKRGCMRAWSVTPSAGNPIAAPGHPSWGSRDHIKGTGSFS